MKSNDTEAAQWPMALKTPEIVLCPVELSNVALRVAPRMLQNMQY